MRFRSRLGIPLIVGLGAFVACDDDTEVPQTAAPVEVKSGGATVRVALDPFELTILGPKGNEVLRTLKGGEGTAYGAPAATRDDGLDNIKLIPGWDGYEPDEKPWQHGAKGKVTAKTDTTASFELAAGTGTVALDVLVEGSKVSIALTAKGQAETGEWNKSSLAFQLKPDEHFFGLGERFTSVDHRGISMYSWAEEGGTGKG